MFLGKSARPGTREFALEWLGLANSNEWLTEDRFDQIEGP